MNAWHVYARHYNFGDYGLGIGVRNLFQKYCDANLLYKLFDTHDLVFDRREVNKLNADADLLIVGGGGLINEFGGRWLFQMPDRMMRHVTTPIVVYGIGYNQFRGQGDVSPGVLDNVRRLQEKALAFSVRNDGSKEELARLGLQVEEVPDPGFFLDAPYPAPPVEGDYCVVQLAADLKQLRGVRDECFLPQMADVVSYILGQGLRVVLAPHVRADGDLCEGLLSKMGNPAGAAVWPLMRLLRDECNFEGLGYYRHARFVIAMRGHAQIFPIGMGIPVVTIVNHRKHRDLICKLGLSEAYSVEIADPALGGKIKHMVQRVMSEREVLKQHCRECVAGLEQTAAAFIQSSALTLTG